ncbi:signal peptidase I [Propionicicella superfundia]|uniref:signal peptidase I n=1 Tax=Propionicicella superfundia TaxID=348582 RepID=UPI00041B660C|nr:signal peptidase I [Propionicicella superfundia]
MADDAHDESGSVASARGGRSGFGGLLKELTIIVVGALVISTVIRVFVAQMFIIPSGSMENTLHVSDRVLVQKVTHFARGDVVVFQDPGGWLAESSPVDRGVVGDVLVFVGLMPDESTGHLIKRVIGLPGDTVSCCDAQGRITVNGQAIDETSYLYADDSGQVAPSDFAFTVTVPADHVFVMGDHRNNSRDSRCHLRDPAGNGEPMGSAAFVPVSDVVGTAVWIVFPFSRWGGLSQPATFTAVPDPPAAPAQAVITDSGPGC